MKKAGENFVQLHCHNEYSLLDGLSPAEDWVKRAKELGMSHLGLTNHANVDGNIRFQQACDSEGIIPVHGCEVYMVPDIMVKEKGEKRYHITLLVKNNTGWKNLLQMLTKANLNGFYYRPRIDPSILLDHLEGLVVMTACASTFLRMPEIETLMPKILDKTEVVGEIMPLDIDDSRTANQLAVQASIDYGFNLVATNDCHYINKGDDELQEVLLAMQRKVKWSNPDRWKFDFDELYIKTEEEMADAFMKYSGLDVEMFYEAIDNSHRVAKLCENFRIEKREPKLPKVFVPGMEDLDEDEQLIQLVLDGLYKRANHHDWIRDNIKGYEERIYEELSEIMPKFTRYFLIVWELIHWCERNDIMSGPGRGSVGGSLVSYCLGITHVDPIKYKLVFSRFISPGRIDLPDIDMDFEDRKRELVKKHLADTYGKWNVIEVSTFLKMHGRGALRDVSRVFDIPLVEVGKAAKCIVTRSGGDFRADFTIEDAFATFEDGINFREKYPEITRMAIAFEGQVKAAGRHAAGVCVSEHDLRSGENANFVVRKGVNVCNWDKEDAEYMGLMKLDILGLNSLTILAESRDLIKERHNVDINYNLINIEDPKIYEQFTAGNTIGIFQFNSSSMIKLCRDVHGENFDQVVAINALHRPGALRSGMCQQYRDRKFGIKEVPKKHPILMEITRDTYGLILYQEQIMKMMYELGNLPWKTADTIRKVVSKSKGVEQFMSFKDDFIKGCQELGTLDEKEADEVFDELKNYGSYGFNLSHAVEYSLIAVWQMYLKVYYPLELMTTLLSFGPANKKHELINEAKRLGIKINLPDINHSDSDIWIIGDDDSLLAPFREVKGIGEVASKEIVECRRVAGAYTSPEDLESKLKKRKTLSKANKKVRNTLIAIKAYESSKDKLNTSETELEELSEYFDFELSNDPLHKYRKLIKKLSEKIEILDLSDSYDIGDKSKFFFGRMETLRVGYREAAQKTKDSSQFGSMGGVYGNLKDDTDFKMLIFGNKIYNEKKYTIEHCEGEVVLTLARNSDDKAALMTQASWFGDELLAGEIQGLSKEDKGLGFGNINVYNGNSSFTNNISECSKCELREQCLNPVLPSYGTLNAMIVGEAPGRDEDRLGEGFVGRSGKLLWSVLESNGLEREFFHITNICKCFPSTTKTPKKKHIKECEEWLKKEIETVKPFIILSFGNTGNYFFRGQDSGIMAINGTTKWHPDYNCWVTYSVHPAMATYSAENLPLLEESIDEFAKKIDLLM